MPSSQRQPIAYWVCSEERSQKVKGSDLSPLRSTDEDTPGVMCPVLGSARQEGHGLTGSVQQRTLFDAALRTGGWTRQSPEVLATSTVLWFYEEIKYV